mmetsp:Transcript_27699/g.65045  ORF Transcript_27699/g.65045 Transcript_27699/m.65045 type:complete len:1449 (-) Transcript_27699:626-4972(-)
MSGGGVEMGLSPERTRLSPAARMRRMKLLPVLLCAGLSYMTFCEKSKQLGMSVAASETFDVMEGPEDLDLVTLDDFDIYDSDQPNHRSLGGAKDEAEDATTYHKDDDYLGNNDSAPMPPEIIVVAAMDGTLAGISKQTGKVVWTQSEGFDGLSSTCSSSSLMKSTVNSAMKRDDDARQILKPLVSTTTTTKSASDATYKAVPSVDGTIYVTTKDASMTSSVKDLVARSPFLDSRGKFYVGSRHAVAAALDGETGEILRVVSPSASTNPGDFESNLDDRNVIWIGRVDHEISVQDAKSGLIDAQFSVGEVMSVTDMRGIVGKTAWKRDDAIGLKDFSFSSTAVTTPSDADAIDDPSVLVATPNGNVALLDFDDDKLAWIADEVFDSPIAYAMDATTGQILDVDIIPDVTDPNASIDDLTREMERQTALASLTDTPVVGAMSNGQLFALPLRRRPGPGIAKSNGASIIASTPSTAAAASSGSVMKHGVSQLPGRLNANFHQHDSSNGIKQQNHQYQHQHQEYNSEYGMWAAKKVCHSSSPAFPSCLIEGNNDLRVLNPESNPEPPPAIGDDNQQELVIVQKEEGGFHHPIYGYVSPEDMGGFYHPVYGYLTPRDLFTSTRTNKRSDQKFFRVLGSWLPPTIALLFVVSFELGRRKRSKDEKNEQKNNFYLTPEQMEKVQALGTGDADTSNNDQQGPEKAQQQEVITVSEEVLGYGGHGTVVYKGVLDGRNVAVKRMLKAYHASADREISLLIESDGDPNVVRYFLKEVRGDFVYLALELCDLSLHELIGVLRQKQQEKALSILSDVNEAASVLSSESTTATLRILFQIASGVKHLHSLRIVHRDLKPANILLAISKKGKKKVKEDDPIFTVFVQNYYDAKISDMGLGKQLIGQSSIGASFIGESSFRGNKSNANSIGVGPGTVGWQAPEVMAIRLTSDTSARSSDSNNQTGESKEGHPASDLSPGIRTSRSVDIFSLGCIFYSLLIPGFHPFGEWFEREANIMHNRPKLDPLKKISMEAYHLVRSMLHRDPRLRPTAKEVIEHPFFWDPQKKMAFLCDFSDRLETDLIAQSSSNAFSSLAIERGAVEIVGTSWEPKLDGALIDNVQKFRTYDYACIRDLLRLIRNKHHHFEELPEAFRMGTAPNQDALYRYFAAQFPALTMHCFSFCGQNLTEGDPMALKFDIPPAKPDAKVVSAAPTSVTLKKKPIVLDEECCSVDQTTAIVSDTEVKIEIVDGNSAEAEATDDSDNESGDDINVKSNEPDDDVTVKNNDELHDDILVWEGSLAAKKYNCRGWHRSQDEWSRHIEPFYKKRDPTLKRRMEDPKFRTRLCNNWDASFGTFCPMKKKNKCVFAHHPCELRVKEGKKNRWGKLVDKNGNNSNPFHSGGEDTYGAARSIEIVRKEEGKWNVDNKNNTHKKKNSHQGQGGSRKKKSGFNNNTPKRKPAPKALPA